MEPTNKKRSLLIIGDVHGKIESYQQIVEQAVADGHYTLQLGDLGWWGHYAKCNLFIDEKRSFFFPGNHDQPPYQVKGYLGRFGFFTPEGGPTFFFIGGGHSIDKSQRTPGLDWWSNEELAPWEMDECGALYREIKPSILITHEAPVYSAEKICSPGILRYFGYEDNWHSDTSRFIQGLIDIHTPKKLIHGHLHRDRKFRYKGCQIVSLGELSTYLLTAR